jgi:hypothetical protein
MELNKLETFKMLLNRCYGGFRFSGKAHKLYHEKTQCEIEFPHESYRFDPITIELVEKYGMDMCERSSCIQVIDVYKILKDYIVIDEYDGFESYSYDIEKYMKCEIRKIIDSKQSDMTKIGLIKNVISLELQRESQMDEYMRFIFN